MAPGCGILVSMGLTQVTTTVRNPAAPERTWEALFLVDTGAVDCLAPRKSLADIGLAVKGRRTYELADGSEIEGRWGYVQIRQDDVVHNRMIFHLF